MTDILGQHILSFVRNSRWPVSQVDVAVNAWTLVDGYSATAIDSKIDSMIKSCELSVVAGKLVVGNNSPAQCILFESGAI